MTIVGQSHLAQYPSADALAAGLDAAIEEVVTVHRDLQDGPAPVAETYIEGAIGALMHARDALAWALAPDEGSRWRARLSEAGITQGGERGARLSATLEDAGFRAHPRPDIGADLIRSERMIGLAASDGFAALLASALAEHRWLHLASGSTWCGTWPAADALVRALAAGRVPAKIGHRAMRGTLGCRCRQ